MKFIFYISLIFIFFACGTKKKLVENASFSSANYPYIEKFHEAMRFKQKGQYPQAIASFEVCKSLNPNDDAVHYALAQLYLLTQQMPKSAEAIQMAVKLDPKNKWYIQEYAYMLFETKNYKEAANQFKTLSKIEPQNVEWLFSYAEALMRAGDFQSAVKALDKLENEIGVNPELSVQKFSLYRKIKQDEKALSEIEKALAVFPSNVQLLANLVDFYFEKKQDEKAFAYLIQLAEHDPTNGNAHLALAQYYDQKGERKKSYEELIKAFKCDDVKADTKVKIVLSMFENQYKLEPEMLELSTILVNQYPTDARVYTVRGDFYLKDKKEDLALDDFKKALEFDKTRFIIWEQVLLMEYQKQDFASLYNDASVCLEYFPSQAKVYLFFAMAANQLKKFEETEEKIALGLDLISNDVLMKAEMLAQKGEALFALKKLKEGKEAYEQSIALDSKNVLYKNNYAYRLALAKQDLDKAESLIKQVLETNDKESHFIDTYGWILFQKGKYEEALTQFNLALNISPNDKHITEHLGDALFKLGKIENALENWKKAKELGSSNLKLNEKIEKKTYYEPVY